MLGLALFTTLPLGAENRAPYDESGNGEAQLEAAKEEAKKNGRRVLVQLGGNWCHWCHRLEAVMRTEPFASFVPDHFTIVRIDTRSNEDLVKQLAPSTNTVPYLMVLDGGTVLAQQNTEPFEGNDGPEMLLKWLKFWAAPTGDAMQALTQAQVEAEQTGRRIFLVVSSTSCGWCKQLDRFMGNQETLKLLSKDYVIVPVVSGLTRNADIVIEKYRKIDGGVPWFAVLDPHDQTLMTADGPNGNCGYPFAEDEVAYFITVIEKTAQHMTADEVRRVGVALDAANKRIRAARS
jgi:thioredoxin-related protein